ncbi:YkoF family thiamine/hydroxymethylpyrimidine-binding protein [Alteromonas sp. CYL-A6]|uniref:YkoF family thiamine/hydroxymethylpyrimidine-binding protein n=1 Tax=Alteromonas nitratireducens TaxID=3390813 RepID=UPI0034C4825F
MNVMAELSLYPLTEQYIGPIKTFIERLHCYEGITVSTSSTSTQVSGDYATVVRILGEEMQRTHEEVGQAVFVAKFLNFDKMQQG